MTSRKNVTGYMTLLPQLYEVGKTYECEDGCLAARFDISVDSVSNVTGGDQDQRFYEDRGGKFLQKYCVSAWDCIFFVSANKNDIVANQCGDFITADKVTVINRLTIDDVIKQQVKYAKKSKSFLKIKNKQPSISSEKQYQSFLSSVRRSSIATAGDFSTIVFDGGNGDFSDKACSTTGFLTKIFATSDRVRISASGYYTFIATSGTDACLSASASNCDLAATGANTTIASAGGDTRITGKGNNNRIAAAGDGSSCSAAGENNVIAIVGKYGKFKGIKGTQVCAANYDKNGKCIGFVTGEIGKNGLKPDVTYTTHDGQFIELQDQQNEGAAE
ncbi:hypothetical protein [Bartonella choladocola]|uniref:hypothetical protein n=1 Tax=Bartonella choladocola TaxID=2750995 RepID=UPI003B51C760